MLISTVIVLNAWLIFSSVIMIHYFGIDAISSILYVPNEPCPPNYEQFGNHCFGDYSWVEFRNFATNPWESLTWLYFAGAMIPSLIFQIFGNLVGSTSLGMFAYLAVMMLVMSIPSIWASKGKEFWQRILIFCIFGVLSIPALWAFDRGNVVGWAILGIWISATAIMRPDTKTNNFLVILGLVIATFVKPQLGLGIIAFILIKRYRWFFIGIASIGLSNVAAFLIYPRDFPTTIWQAIQGATAFNDVVDVTQTSSPLTVSFPKGAYLLSKLLEGLPGFSSLPAFIQNHQILVSFFCIVFIVFALFLAREYLSPAFLIVLLFLTGSLALPISFGYYLITTIPVAALILRNIGNKENVSPSWSGEFDQDLNQRWYLLVAKGIVVIVTGLSISRLMLWIPGVSFFPMNEYPSISLVHTTGPILGIAWFISIILLAVAIRLNVRYNQKILLDHAKTLKKLDLNHW